MCFDNKINTLVYTIKNIGRLPNIDEFSFEDDTDQRSFYDEIEKEFKNINEDTEDIIITGYLLMKQTLNNNKAKEIEAEERLNNFKNKLMEEKLKNEKIEQTSKYIERIILEEEQAKEEEKLMKVRLKEERKRLRQEAKKQELERQRRLIKLRKIEKDSLELVKSFLTEENEIVDKDKLMDELCQMWYPNSYTKKI